ncbi:ATP phosphoribosyltransferase [Sphingomicrobium aestuariivivum]|uniref:ATP phosphoribosyltransferase n=1 Tax=Sphingomicrobium aestuariivivum TaxID=1582356 RepID=UPI001FD6AC1A|nr:ATP phosphoribosyltransferase [Sphingomicrobium aestuariivivum]MCJ8191128.1 ATP phosphoribosyltransferase [Sphingomicrobium aestuariivivum]
MTATMTRLRMAVQKSGRLADAGEGLLSKAGLRIRSAKGQLTARATNFPLDLMLVRDDDIPTLVGDGVCDLGIVGLNVLEEYRLDPANEDVDVLARLGFGGCALKVAIPVAEDWSLGLLEGKRIATSYPLLTRAFLEKEGISAEVVTMHGAVELAPRLGIADYVCDLVSTGQTLEANGLKPVHTILESESVLIRTRATLADEQVDRADALKTRMLGVIATAESKYIVLNAPESALPEITRILPGAEAPTVMPLLGMEGHVAIQAVARESVFWETLEALKAAGARDILVMPIEKMML